MKVRDLFPNLKLKGSLDLMDQSAFELSDEQLKSMKQASVAGKRSARELNEKFNQDN